MSKSYDIDSRLLECADATEIHISALSDLCTNMALCQLDTSVLNEVILGLQITASKLQDTINE